jgi:hypothetical protein
MSDEQFFAFLSACRDELADKQARFQARIAGAARWYYDMADCSLTIGEHRFGMVPVGTFSHEQQTWLWAWANDSYPDIARAASRRIQGLHDATGFRVFLNQGTPAEPSDALDFTALAAHHLGAIGFFRASNEAIDLYLAVTESPASAASPS